MVLMNSCIMRYSNKHVLVIGYVIFRTHLAGIKCFNEEHADAVITVSDSYVKKKDP